MVCTDPNVRQGGTQQNGWPARERRWGWGHWQGSNHSLHFCMWWRICKCLSAHPTPAQCFKKGICCQLRKNSKCSESLNSSLLSKATVYKNRGSLYIWQWNDGGNQTKNCQAAAALARKEFGHVQLEEHRMKFFRWNVVFYPNKETKGGSQSDVQTRQMHMTVTHEVQKGAEPPARAEMCKSFPTWLRAAVRLVGPSQRAKKVRKQESGLSQHQGLPNNMLRYGLCWAVPYLTLCPSTFEAMLTPVLPAAIAKMSLLLTILWSLIFPCSVSSYKCKKQRIPEEGTDCWRS